jgi:hypothetical protein
MKVMKMVENFMIAEGAYGVGRRCKVSSNGKLHEQILPPYHYMSTLRTTQNTLVSTSKVFLDKPLMFVQSLFLLRAFTTMPLVHVCNDGALQHISGPL